MATRLDSLSTPSGAVVQTAYAELAVGSSVSTSAVIGTSGAITQSDGAEILTCTITPKSASNYLFVMANIDVAFGANTGFVAMVALFRDSGNAVAYGPFYTNSYLYGVVPIQYRTTAGSTSATTFKIRGGPHSPGTTGLFGGALNGPSYPGGTGTIGATLTVMEIAA